MAVVVLLIVQAWAIALASAMNVGQMMIKLDIEGQPEHKLRQYNIVLS